MKKVVVVGASTGLGRCIGIGLAQRGSHVALLARRREKIDAAALEAGENAIALRCDATDPAACVAAFSDAAEAMDGIDAVVYAAAVGPLVKLSDASPEQWMSTFETNVVGAVNVTQAALPYLSRSAGRILYMSTIGASQTAPWPGLGIYQITKAALERLAESWRAEEPGVDFVRIAIGECAGGEGDNQTHFIDGWDPELAAEIVVDWFNSGLMTGQFIDIEHLIEVFHSIIEAGPALQTPSLTIVPRSPGRST